MDQFFVDLVGVFVKIIGGDNKGFLFCDDVGFVIVKDFFIVCVDD